MFNKKYDFIAIDCEKASNQSASLCSIGIACFKHGKIKDTKEYIIKPYPFEFYSGAIINDTYHGVPLNVYETSRHLCFGNQKGTALFTVPHTLYVVFRLL